MGMIFLRPMQLISCSRQWLTQADLLYGDWKWVENPEKYSFKKSQNNQTKIMSDAITKLLDKGWGGSSNLMIKTESFKKVGGCDENIFVGFLNTNKLRQSFKIKSVNITKLQLLVS